MVLVGLAAASRLRTLPVYGRASDAVSTVLVFAAGMLLGAGAVAVALASGLLHAAVRRLPWCEALLSCGNYALAAVLAPTVFGAARIELALGNLPLLVVLAAATGLVHHADTPLVGAAIGAEHGTTVLEAPAEHFAWLWPHYPVLGVLALLLALAYRGFGLFGVTAFAAPPAMRLHAAKQHLDRTAAGVREVHGLRDELDDEVRRRLDAEADQRSVRPRSRLHGSQGSPEPSNPGRFTGG